MQASSVPSERPDAFMDPQYGPTRPLKLFNLDYKFAGCASPVARDALFTRLVRSLVCRRAVTHTIDTCNRKHYTAGRYDPTTERRTGIQAGEGAPLHDRPPRRPPHDRENDP